MAVLAPATGRRRPGRRPRGAGHAAGVRVVRGRERLADHDVGLVDGPLGARLHDRLAGEPVLVLHADVDGEDDRVGGPDDRRVERRGAGRALRLDVDVDTGGLAGGGELVRGHVGVRDAGRAGADHDHAAPGVGGSRGRGPARCGGGCGGGRRGGSRRRRDDLVDEPDDLLVRRRGAQGGDELGPDERPGQRGEQRQVVGVAVRGRRDQEGEVGRTVRGTEVDLRGQPGERERRLGHGRGPAVRDRDPAGQAGRRLRLAGHGVAVQGVGAGGPAGGGDQFGQPAHDRALVGAEIGVERDQVGGDECGHGTSPGGVSGRPGRRPGRRRAAGATCCWVGAVGHPGGDLDGGDVHLGRGGKCGSGHRRRGRAVGDRGPEALGRRGAGQVGEQVAGQAAVTGADGAADGDGGRPGRPDVAVGGRQQRAVAAQGEQHLGDAPVVQRAHGGQGHRRVAEDLVLGHPGQLGELLGVRLEQVRRRVGAGGQQREQRRLRGVDGDARAGVAQRGDERGVPVHRGAGGQRAGERHPAGAGGVPVEGVGQRGAGGVVQRGAGLVELGRGAVGLGERVVGADGGRHRHRGQLQPERVQGADDRVVVGRGQHADDVAAGRRDRAGHVDALAAGLGGARAEPDDAAALERGGHGRGCGRGSGSPSA